MDERKLRLFICYYGHYLLGISEGMHRIFMFDHFVSDINPKTAQLDFAITRLLFRISGLVGGLFLPLITGRGKWFYLELVLTYGICGGAYMVYTLAKNTVLAIGSWVIIGFCSNAIFIVYSEVSRISTEKSRSIVVLKTSAIAGTLTASVFRFLSPNMRLEITENFVITGSTLPSFILALLYWILAVFLLTLHFVTASSKTTTNTKSKELVQHKAVEAGISKDTEEQQQQTKILSPFTVFTILLYTFLIHLNVETVAVTQQETSKFLGLSDATSALLFVLRYSLVMAFNVFTFYILLPNVSHKRLLVMWQTCRMVLVGTCFWINLLSNGKLVLAMLYFVCFLDPVVYQTDDAVLLPMLSGTKHHKMYLAVTMVAWNAGYLCSFLVPLLYNIVEFVYSIDLFLLAVCLVLTYVNNII